MKRAASLLLAVAMTAPAGAAQRPSNISVALETGISSGSLSNHKKGTLHGGTVKYDISPQWSAGARLQSRTFKQEDNTSQRTVIRPLSAVGFYRPWSMSPWTPYALAELGVSNNQSMVFSLKKTSSKPFIGLGIGGVFRPFQFNAFSFELAHRRFAGASPNGYQVTETAFSFSIAFYIPDDWIPIRPKTPLKIPDMDKAAQRPAATPSGDADRSQAQRELDKVQQDIRERKAPPIHFETGQAVLLKESFETLDIVGTILRRYPQLSVLITGHTDNVGSAEDNDILSLARAEVVRAYLIQNFGLPSDKLAARGAGLHEPIADNETEDGRYFNRRVEFTIQR